MSVLRYIHSAIFMAMMLAYFIGSIGHTVASHSHRPSRVTLALSELYLWVLPFVWVIDMTYVVRCAAVGEVFGAMIFVGLAWLHHREWKKSGDDRWKKLRRKVSSKVGERGGRLVVMPA